MARFLQWSDIHREFQHTGNPIGLPQPTAECPAGSIDAILIAGDLDKAERHVANLIEIQQAWEVPVVSIFGNHEPYGSSVQAAREKVAEDLVAARARGYDVHVLDRDTLTIGDTRILGATLWTDFNILGNAEEMMFAAQYVMNDYHKVKQSPDTESAMRPEDTLAMHQRDKAWLLDELDRPFDGKTLVMTHHLPVPEALSVKAGKGSYAPAYVNDMRGDILGLKIDTWVSGHTHYARRGYLPGRHGPISFTANMHGYMRGGVLQETNFQPYLVIDTQDPQLGLDQIDIEDPYLSELPSVQDILAGMDTPEITAP
jgi:hypothetical protein